MARRLVDAGKLSSKVAANSDLRNVVWNLIGTHTEKTSLEFATIDLSIGDAIVLCSDGLAAVVSEQEISLALEATGTASDTCERLFEIARRKGLSDDATIVVARFTRGDMDSPSKSAIHLGPDTPDASVPA